MTLNLVIAAVKGGLGLWSGSLAIATDAIHSLVDGGANLVGLVAMRIAAAPPDAEHPYGHRKVEIVAAAGIGVAVGITAVRFAWGAVEALLAGREPPATSGLGFAILIATWIANMFVAAYEFRRARQLRSEYLAADSAHTASDVLVTAAVLASYSAAHHGAAWADPIGALVIVVVIAHVAWRVLAHSVAVLVDQAVLDADEICQVVAAVAGVRGCHRVRSRGSSRAAHLDMHLLLDGSLSLRRAHEIAHEVECAVKDQFPEIVDVTVHMEPEEDGPEPL